MQPSLQNRALPPPEKTGQDAGNPKTGGSDRLSLADLNEIFAEIAEEEALLATTPTPQVIAAGQAARERGKLERAALADRLRREDAHDLASKIDDCGSILRLMCTTCSAVKKVEVACKRRWCPACAFLVQRQRLKRYQFAVSLMQWPLFITLTIENTTNPECIRTIREFWGKFRRRKLIADRIQGGVSTIEVTNEGNGWHPHLHILADCEWLALHTPKPYPRDNADTIRQKCDFARLELSALWAHLVGQQKAIVLAKRVGGNEALIYSLKYATKGSELLECKEPIAPLIRVLSKSRMLSAFGTLHGQGLDDPEEEKPACICPDCMNETSYIPEHIMDMMLRRAYDSSHCIR